MSFLLGVILVCIEKEIVRYKEAVFYWYRVLERVRFVYKNRD